MWNIGTALLVLSTEPHPLATRKAGTPRLNRRTLIKTSGALAVTGLGVGAWVQSRDTYQFTRLIHSPAEPNTILRGNSARTGAMPGPGPNPDLPIVIGWSANVDQWIWNGPNIIDQSVYLAGARGSLRDLDMTSGQEQRSLPYLWMPRSAPVISNNIAYMALADAEVGALDLESEEYIWKTSAGLQSRRSPLLHDGLVIIDVEEGGLIAINAATGEIQWQHITQSNLASSPAIFDIQLFHANETGISCIDPSTGEVIWQFSQSNWKEFLSPSAAEGIVFTIAQRWDRTILDGRHMLAFEAISGELLWTHPVLISAEWSDGTPAVANGIVYTSHGISGIVALDAETGIELWQVAREGYALHTATTIAEGIVYFGRSGDGLCALDATSGEQIWNVSLEDEHLLSEPVVTGGVVYIGGDRRHLYAIGNPAE